MDTTNMLRYHIIPGAMGVTFVTGTILVSKYVGIALMWIPVVAGQMVCSLTLDVRVSGIPLTVTKVLAIVLVMIGSFLSVFERIGSIGLSDLGFAGWHLLLA